MKPAGPAGRHPERVTCERCGWHRPVTAKCCESCRDFLAASGHVPSMSATQALMAQHLGGSRR